MKTKFGTALALAAVLLTGIAAAAINTQALISPTESTLGTAATTLLPAEQVVSVSPENTPVASGVPTEISTSGQAASKPSDSGQAKNNSNSVPSNSNGVSLSPIPEVSIASEPSAVTQAPTTSPTFTTPSPTPTSIVYGNPNPSNGDDDDDDENEEEDNDGDDD